MLKNKLKAIYSEKIQSQLFTNSFWGILSNIFQNILFSVFFIVIARKYSTSDFANYILANTLYGFMLAFSSLGLGQWFIRELMVSNDKQYLVNKFFKIQIASGLFFYLINIALAYSLYSNQLIRNLSLLIGINVIFDNIIYVIKYINIAEFEQKKTFLILTIEALLKFIAACLLFISTVPIIYLAAILILLRFITLNLFIKIGSSNLLNLRKVLMAKVNLNEIKSVIATNWMFIVIGSSSVIYWRVGNILVSKLLSLKDVSNYEISFKFFSIAEILPIIISTSVFPILVRIYGSNKETIISHKFYKDSFLGYALYGLLAYTFIYSFSDSIVPFLFGEKYTNTSIYCKEMFLTILVFPTALLQANLLISLKLEKTDMWLNLISLTFNFFFCLIGLYFFKSLSIVNYSILISFIVFHICQDFVLIHRKIISLSHAFKFYFISILLVLAYHYFSLFMLPVILFISFWLCIIMIYIFYTFKFRPING